MYASRDGIEEYLRELNEKSGRTIYDENKKSIIINDIDNLTEYEKLAILAAFTGDLDRNMFAAEVVFHAEGLVDLWSNTAIGDIMDWYESCIIADMKNGEIGLDEKIVEKFYDVDDESNQIQRQLHGKQ